MAEERKNNRKLPLQTGGEDSAQDGVAPGIDHYLVLILAEMMDCIALTENSSQMLEL